MFLRLFVKLAAALVLISTLPGAAFAESQLRCLEKSQGKKLQWSASWSDDRQDEGVEYEIVGVTVKDKMPERSVTLQLHSSLPRVRLASRTVKADSEESARRICDRFQRRVERGANPFEASDEAGDFIQYTNAGWVRADPPAQEPLTTCPVGAEQHPIIFRCRASDKNRYGAALKALEEQLRYLE